MVFYWAIIHWCFTGLLSSGVYQDTFSVVLLGYCSWCFTAVLSSGDLLGFQQ